MNTLDYHICKKQESGLSPQPCTAKCPLLSSGINNLSCCALRPSPVLCLLCVMLMWVFMSVHHYLSVLRQRRGLGHSPTFSFLLTFLSSAFSFLDLHFFSQEPAVCHTVPVSECFYHCVTTIYMKCSQIPIWAVVERRRTHTHAFGNTLSFVRHLCHVSDWSRDSRTESDFHSCATKGTSPFMTRKLTGSSAGRKTRRMTI